VQIDEIRLAVIPLECRFVVRVDGVMGRLPVLEVLDKVRGKEALSDGSLAVEEDDKSLGHGCVVVRIQCGSDIGGIGDMRAFVAWLRGGFCSVRVLC
jgi:hypothetical protein